MFCCRIPYFAKIYVTLARLLKVKILNLWHDGDAAARQKMRPTTVPPPRTILRLMFLGYPDSVTARILEH